jgi:hypothetical protein
MCRKWRVMALTVLVCLEIPAVRAQDSVPVGERQIMQIIDSLPPPVRAALLDRQDGFVDWAAQVIGAYGGPDGIDPTSVDLFINVTRADARSRATARLLDADLTADGLILRTEVEGLCKVVSAYTRGQLRRAFDRADADRDQRITPAELRAYAEAAAQKDIGKVDEQILRSLPLLDLDRDGLVSVAEVAAIVAFATASAAKLADKAAVAGKTEL